MRSAAAVVVEDLHKTYPGPIEAVRGLWFDVSPGEVFGLLGPNGAGKSTTLGVLTSVVHPTRGRAYVAGHDVPRDRHGMVQGTDPGLAAIWHLDFEPLMAALSTLFLALTAVASLTFAVRAFQRATTA